MGTPDWASTLFTTARAQHIVLFVCNGWELSLVIGVNSAGDRDRGYFCPVCCLDRAYRVYTVKYYWCVDTTTVVVYAYRTALIAPCGPGSCTIRPAQFSGRRSYELTKPGFSFFCICVVVFLCSRWVSIHFCCVRLGFFCTSQEIGWEQHLRNNRSCVKWDVKLQRNQSASAFIISILKICRSDVPLCQAVRVSIMLHLLICRYNYVCYDISCWTLPDYYGPFLTRVHHVQPVIIVFMH